MVTLALRALGLADPGGNTFSMKQVKGTASLNGTLVVEIGNLANWADKTHDICKLYCILDALQWGIKMIWILLAVLAVLLSVRVLRAPVRVFLRNRGGLLSLALLLLF